MIRREIDFTNLRRICMSKELKMEVFASKEPVKSVRLHVYEFHTSELYENKYRLIRSAAWKIRNVNACGVFEDGSYIYTTEKISEEIPNVNFRLLVILYMNIRKICLQQKNSLIGPGSLIKWK